MVVHEALPVIFLGEHHVFHARNVLDGLISDHETPRRTHLGSRLMRLIFLIHLFGVPRIILLNTLFEESRFPRQRFVRLLLVVQLPLQNLIFDNFLVHIPVFFVATGAKLEFLRRQIRLLFGSRLKYSTQTAGATLGLFEEVGDRDITLFVDGRVCVDSVLGVKLLLLFRPISTF